MMASMRPRHKAAENRALSLDMGPMHVASMRPRHKAAENPHTPAARYLEYRRFNEAAA